MCQESGGSETTKRTTACKEDGKDKARSRAIATTGLSQAQKQRQRHTSAQAQNGRRAAKHQDKTTNKRVRASRGPAATPRTPTQVQHRDYNNRLGLKLGARKGSTPEGPAKTKGRAPGEQGASRRPVWGARVPATTCACATHSKEVHDKSQNKETTPPKRERARH